MKNILTQSILKIKEDFVGNESTFFMFVNNECCVYNAEIILHSAIFYVSTMMEIFGTEKYTHFTECKKQRHNK